MEISERDISSYIGINMLRVTTAIIGAGMGVILIVASLVLLCTKSGNPSALCSMVVYLSLFEVCIFCVIIMCSRRCASIMRSNGFNYQSEDDRAKFTSIIWHMFWRKEG